METVLDHKSAPGANGLALFRLMPAFRRDPLRTFVDLARRYGDLVCFRGLWTSFMLTDPQHVEYVLQTNSRNYRKGKNYKELAASTGNGLFVSEGDVWLRQRRLAQPAFHRERVASFARIMTDSCEAMLERWRPYAENHAPIQIDAEMLRLTLGIVGKALFSRDLSDEADTMSQSFEVIRNHTTNRIMSVVKFPAWFPTLSPGDRKRRAYFPFGAGPRQCIGNNFALMEAQIIIATVVQRYRLRLVDERTIEPETSVTLRPRGGIQMNLSSA